MYNILVVDDELPIREWLEFCIKNQLGAEVSVDSAVNGQAALNLALEREYDVVITDIKMPVMNGIELAKQINARKPETRVIVLTSYDDFEFARSMVKYRVYDYILKAEISGEYIADAIMGCVKSVGRSSQSDQAALLKLFDLLDAIPSDPAELDEGRRAQAFELLKRLRAVVPQGPYFCFAVPSQADAGAVFNPHGEFKTLFTLSYQQASLGCAQLGGGASQLTDFVAGKAPALNYSGLVSVTQASFAPADLPCMLALARRGLALRFYNMGPVILAAQEPAEIESRLYSLCSEALAALDSGMGRYCESARQAISGFFEYIEKETPGNISVVRELCCRICERARMPSAKDMQADFLAECAACRQDIDHIEDFYELRDYVQKCLEGATGAAAASPQNPVIRKAIAYIENNYGNIRRMSEVANAVYLSPEYFSRLFKEETGVNFSAYLNDYRLEQAALRMRDAQCKVYQVAEEVGFSSLSYFSQNFKKKYGVNPFKYRCQLGKG